MNLRGIFWKIFAGFFLANLLVMGLTTYIVLEISDSELTKEHHKRLQQNVAAVVVEQYETTQRRGIRQTIRIPLLANALNTKPRKLGRIHKRMEIYNARGERIFGYISADHGHRKDHKHSRIPEHSNMPSDTLMYSYTSPASGMVYRIVAKPPEMPPGVGRLLRFTQSVRFILLLLASVVVSFILSLLITRPLKQLGQHARSLASGDWDTRVADQLTRRGDEIGELSREMDEMANQLSELINSKQQLLHDVSHELRAPLARLQAASALLEQKDSSDPNIQRIEKECQRMSSLIEEILRFSQFNADTENRLFSKLDLASLLTDLVADVQYEYPKHPINVLQFDKDVVVNGDADSLHSAFENILRNACKHTPEATNIDISLVSGEMAHITIRDHGQGVSEDELHILSKPFYRAGQTMHGDGFGLGLSIAQRAIELHKGSMSIHNHQEGGLSIEIQLPLHNITKH